MSETTRHQIDKDGLLQPIDGGMSLRDWFAGMAMQAMFQLDHADDVIATAAYCLADEMLKAREKFQCNASAELDYKQGYRDGQQSIQTLLKTAIEEDDSE